MNDYRVRDLKVKLDDLVERMKAILESADSEKRSLTESENAEYDELYKQAEALRAEIDRREKLIEIALHNIQQGGGAKIGMGEKDLRQYSLLRAIRAAANHDWRGAELEFEASEATAKLLGKQPQGFYVPQDWMEYRNLEQRDLVKGTLSAGGYLVATELLAQSFIEMLRNRMVVQRAGATVLGGLVGDIAIPKQTGGATAYWVAESGAPTESQQTVGQVPLSPKTVGAYTDISRKLLLQSSIDVEAFVRRDLATTLALAIDKAALHGTGSNNQPTGIANTTGIGIVSGGTNGAAPTWAHIVQLETEVAIDNADVGALAYMTNAKVRGKLKATPRTPTYGDIMVWEGNNTPLNGYPAYVTNQVRSDLDKGTSTGVCSAIFFGNWNDLLIGMWGGLDILVDPYTGGTSGTVRVVALQDVDIAVRFPESFAAMLDALTT
ncbi:MAG: phage major capsid protein [Candidatus Methanomethylicaceae archaeon]